MRNPGTLALLFVSMGVTAAGCGGDGGTGVPTGDAGMQPDVTAGDANLSDSSKMDSGPVDTGIDTARECLKPAPPALGITAVTATTFAAPVYAIQAPGSADWYVVEQGGIIRIVRAGVVLPTNFLDISAAMGTSPLGERGLLSVAFHPGYATNGRFFVAYTIGDGADGTLGVANTDHVGEFVRDPLNADRATPTQVRSILDLPVSDPNHNGGTAIFGSDGKLYVGTGDGGGGCESSQPGATQDVSKLFGKILRLDVDIAAPYAAAGNPFSTGDARVYHYGLRNPYRFGFDSATTDLYIGDVGQDLHEEHDFVAANAAGKNFGWPAYEGAEMGTCGPKPLVTTAPYEPPVLSIDRTVVPGNPYAGYRATIGGRVYRGTAIPSLVGVYIFGDYVGGFLGFLRQCGTKTMPTVAVDNATLNAPGGLGLITSIVYGQDGEIYMTYKGRLGKLVPR